MAVTHSPSVWHAFVIRFDLAREQVAPPDRFGLPERVAWHPAISPAPASLASHFHCPNLLPLLVRDGDSLMLPGFQVRAISMSAAAFSASFGMSTMPTRL